MYDTLAKERTQLFSLSNESRSRPKKEVPRGEKASEEQRENNFLKIDNDKFLWKERETV